MPKVKKRTWAFAKTQSQKNKSRKVGSCLHCKQDIMSDDSFVIFATKQPAHHRCYAREAEKEQQQQKVETKLWDNLKDWNTNKKDIYL